MSVIWKQVQNNCKQNMFKLGPLNSKWWNQQEIPYEGYIGLELSFSSNMDKKVSLLFVVTSLLFVVTSWWVAIYPSTLSRKCIKYIIESLVHFINAVRQQELSYVKTPKVHTFVLAGLQAKIKCNIEVEVFEKTILIRFELDLPENEDVTSVSIKLSSRQSTQSYVKIPIITRTNRDITSPPNTIIGSINQVQSLTPIEPANMNFEEE